METIKTVDEHLHAPNGRPHWQESYYFSWFDIDTDAMGFARIGRIPGEGTWNGALMVARGDSIERIAAKMRDKNGSAGKPGATFISVGGLSFEMIEPLAQWRLRLTGRDSMDLTFQAFTRPFDFHAEVAEGNTFPVGAADRHFEQTGTVKGSLTIGGVTHQINGYGQRDKSWGVREWGAIEAWNWIPAVFGPDLGLIAARVTIGGHTGIGGYIFRDGEPRAIAALDIVQHWERKRVPRATTVTATDVSGFTIKIEGTSWAQLPVYTKGAMLQQSPTRWTTTVDGQERTGVGISDYLYHPTLPEKVAFLPKLARLVPRIRFL